MTFLLCLPPTSFWAPLLLEQIAGLCIGYAHCRHVLVARAFVDFTGLMPFQLEGVRDSWSNRLTYFTVDL